MDKDEFWRDIAAWYVMDPDGTVRKASDMEEAAARTGNHTVAFTAFDGGRVEVSTVFLPVAYPRFFGDSGIIDHFETMIFRDEKPDRLWRYETRDQAIIGHDAACALVMADLGQGGIPS